MYHGNYLMYKKHKFFSVLTLETNSICFNTLTLAGFLVLQLIASGCILYVVNYSLG